MRDLSRSQQYQVGDCLFSLGTNAHEKFPGGTRRRRRRFRDHSQTSDRQRQEEVTRSRRTAPSIALVTTLGISDGSFSRDRWGRVYWLAFGRDVAKRRS